MKRKNKIRAKKRIKVNRSPAVKMSGIIADFASDFINMGQTTEERQILLNGACTAWNIANLPSDQREQALNQTLDDYMRINPDADDVDNLAYNLKLLIEKKLKMFPDMKKTVVNAAVEPVGATSYKIHVASLGEDGRPDG